MVRQTPSQFSQVSCRVTPFAPYLFIYRPRLCPTSCYHGEIGTTWVHNPPREEQTGQDSDTDGLGLGRWHRTRVRLRRESTGPAAQCGGRVPEDGPTAEC